MRANMNEPELLIKAVIVANAASVAILGCARENPYYCPRHGNLRVAPADIGADEIQ